MSTFKTQAIVLSKRSFIEDDRFYTLYTKSHGKLEVLVKAAAKTSSKLAGHLEPFTCVEVMIARGRNRETLAGVRIIEFYKFNNLADLSLANLASETINKMIKQGVPDQEVFNLFLKLLPFLAGSSKLEIKKLAVMRFLWQLIRLSGYSISAERNGDFIASLPKLSAAAKKTFALLTVLASTSFKTSTTVLKELENYTKNYLEYILESELKSLNLLAYA